MSDVHKPKKRGRGRPRKNPDRAMTQREINKAYRARRQKKVELMRQLMKQLPAISP